MERRLHCYSGRIVSSGWVCDYRYYYYYSIMVRVVTVLLVDTPTFVVQPGVGVVILCCPLSVRFGRV